MLTFLGTGVLYGLVLAITIGPVFFALIRISINKGFKSGAFLAGGIALSDAFVAFVVYSGISQFTSSPSFQSGAGLVGGIAMLIFGGRHFIQPTEHEEETPAFVNDRSQQNTYARLFGQGVLLNMVNPFMYLFWLGLISNLPNILGANFTQLQGMVFLTGILITVFSTDLLKTYIANQLSNILTNNVIAWVDRIGGIVLIFFGLYLLLYALFGDAINQVFPSNQHHLPL